MSETLKDTERRWYAMRSLFNTELKIKELLDSERIENFLPMDWETFEVGGQKKKRLVPLVRNLIFVRSTPTELAPVMARQSRFQFIYARGGRQNQPIVVPTVQMDSFIRAVEASRAPLYFQPGELPPPQPGQLVRIKSGSLDGVVGRVLKVKGARARRLVVEIPGFLAAAVEVNLADCEPAQNQSC